MNFLIVVLILSSALEIFAERFSVENEIDPVIDFLLNGGDSNSGENVTDKAAIFMTGIWKCGNCTDIHNSKIVYSEENYIYNDSDDDNDDVKQIELVLDGMRCVTVSSDKPGVVRSLTGTCDKAVTLHVKSTRHFVVHVYV